MNDVVTADDVDDTYVGITNHTMRDEIVILIIFPT